METRDVKRLTMAAGILVGAGLGFAFGAGAYTALEPMLEAAESPISELQGLVWNVVPFGTLGGGVLGGIAAQRWRDRRD